MMRTPINILTIAAMLAHALLGCCWHHAHDGQTACAADHADHALVQQDEHAQHDHHAHDLPGTEHAEAGHHGRDSREPCNDERPCCNDQKCKSLASSRVRLAIGPTLVALDGVPASLTGRVSVTQHQAVFGHDDVLRAPPPPRAQRTELWLL